MKQMLTLVFGLFLGLAGMAQIPTPGAVQSQKILLLGGIAHLGTGEVIQNAAIAFENGKLTIVGDATTMRLDLPNFDQVIQLEGKHVYPGFLAPNSRLGLFEIGAVKATLDEDEIGNMLPHVRSIIAYNTDSKIIPTVRTNGVLLAEITPKGGVISGSSSVVQLDAWNWEDAAVKTEVGIHLNWPKLAIQTGWWAEPGKVQKSDSNLVRVERIRQFFSKAQAYCELKTPSEVNLRYEAMRGLFDGTQTLFVHTDFALEIVQAVNLKREFKLPKMAIVGGYDTHFLTQLLKENQVSVVLGRLHRLPLRAEDDVDLPYRLPALLMKDSIPVCLNYAGGMEVMGTRNLPFVAGTAAAYGLSQEQAVQLITLNPAQIMGIADRVGSLEVGKDATLFISEGDALDMRTNQVVLAFIEGRQLELTNHQVELYEKFKAKYETAEDQ